MGSTFAHASEKTTAAAHTVSDQAGRLARRAAAQTGTVLDRARVGLGRPPRRSVSRPTKTLIGAFAAGAVTAAAVAWASLRGRVD
ncbi:hypothetical protein [Streptacidiphilus rugosus]|uniref:hypothetical protein n=1 Tax=Streptacidiphilus rugosus TaxID=405783 RepID=UPI0005689B3D|nr:hypothetical protein [Streptacidiphilus rugosus]